MVATAARGTIRTLTSRHSSACRIHTSDSIATVDWSAAAVSAIRPDRTAPTPAVTRTRTSWIVRATPYWHAVLGITLILITIIFPQGIVGTLRQWRQRWEGSGP